MTHDIEQDASALSPTRRTVLTGAAWTLPVIAAATITPMAAASNAPVLAFDKSTYNGTACGTITGAYVTVTVNNVATAGKSVTTTLSGGYKFSDDTTTNTQVSGSNGRVNLPAINVPATGGTGALSATSGTSNTSATMSGVSNAIAKTWTSAGSTVTYSSVPAGSQAVGWNTYLTSDGNLYYTNSLLAQNVTSAAAQYYLTPSGTTCDMISLVSDGAAKTWTTRGPAWRTFSSVPTGSRVIGWNTYLTNSGDLYYANTLKAQNVTSATVQHVTSGGNEQDWIAYTQATAC
ncbi:hypothetical protein [Microbacterium testaceum]|uniref:Uncharacterized protein n=1 Tax=Microbacterium testaceum TaxID=2033 RepID=A0A147FCZ9_MICTE|nr:hypothetical protein [Microbacterium testaceum]KTS14406.1 hypothetical protein RSA3_00410 [Microbacterium testaceum]